MKREFLENLGIEAEHIDGIMAQHGKNVADLKEQVTKLQTSLETKDTQIGALRDDLITADNEVKKYNDLDVEGLRGQLVAEQDGRVQDKKDFATNSFFAGLGVSDVDYLTYKLKEKLEFDDNNQVANAEVVEKLAKDDFSSLFEKKGQAMAGGNPAFDGGGEKTIRDKIAENIQKIKEK